MKADSRSRSPGSCSGAAWFCSSTLSGQTKKVQRTTNVRIDNLSLHVSDVDLLVLARKFGRDAVLSYRIMRVNPKDPKSASRGYGFVNFKTKAAAQKAVEGIPELGHNLAAEGTSLVADFHYDKKEWPTISGPQQASSRSVTGYAPGNCATRAGVDYARCTDTNGHLFCQPPSLPLPPPPPPPSRPPPYKFPSCSASDEENGSESTDGCRSSANTSITSSSSSSDIEFENFTAPPEEVPTDSHPRTRGAAQRSSTGRPQARTKQSKQVLWRSAGLATSSPYLASHPLETTLVYVGKLSPEVTDEQLRSAANKCSNHKVSSGIQIKTKDDFHGGPAKYRFAIIGFEDVDAARAAKEGLPDCPGLSARGSLATSYYIPRQEQPIPEPPEEDFQDLVKKMLESFYALADASVVPKSAKDALGELIVELRAAPYVGIRIPFIAWMARRLVEAVCKTILAMLGLYEDQENLMLNHLLGQMSAEKSVRQAFDEMRIEHCHLPDLNYLVDDSKTVLKHGNVAGHPTVLPKHEYISKYDVLFNVTKSAQDWYTCMLGVLPYLEEMDCFNKELCSTKGFYDDDDKFGGMRGRHSHVLRNE